MKPKYHFVFCHGWGFTSQVWQLLQSRWNFPWPFTLCDLGYDQSVGQMNLPPFDKDVKMVGIGHSYGLFQLAQKKGYFDRLIGVQSFIFLRHYQARLQKLEALFLLDPCRSLRAFYKMCGLKEALPYGAIRFPNFATLHQGLQHLQKLDRQAHHALRQGALTDMILATHDPIVPFVSSYEQFSDLMPEVKLHVYQGAVHGIDSLLLDFILCLVKDIS